MIKNIDEINFYGKIKIVKLKNGFTLIYKNIPNTGLVAVDLWVKCGSVYENDKNNGLSHFLEHLLFKGTKSYNLFEINSIIEASGGMQNAATSKDFTHYYGVLNSKYADKAINLFYEMAFYASFPPEEVERERKVVLSEIAREKDDPSSYLFKIFNKQIFKQHPYKRLTIGLEKVIKNVSREEIINYYKYYYQPSNMKLVVAGDVDFNKVLEKVKQTFGREKNKRIKLPEFKKEVQRRKPIIKIENTQVKEKYFIFGYVGPVSKDKDAITMDLIADILGSGKTSLLYKRLFDEKKIVSSISAYYWTAAGPGIFMISGSAPQNVDENLIKKEILNVLQKVKKGKFDEKLIENNKLKLKYSFIYGLEKIQSQARLLGYYFTVLNKKFLLNYLKNINSKTKEDIVSAANKYLKNNNYVFCVLKSNEN